MTVYVDDVRHAYGRMVMCHMWADTEAELLLMATKIGVGHRWLQRPPKASWVHFDIALGKKAEALAHGAALTDKYGPSEHTAKLLIATGNPDKVRFGERKLASITRCRGLGFGRASEQ